jgi:hypothetical protein
MDVSPVLSEASLFVFPRRKAERSPPGDAVPNEMRDAVPSEARDASLSLGTTKRGGDASLSLGTTKNGGSAGHGWRGHPEPFFVAPSPFLSPRAEARVPRHLPASGYSRDLLMQILFNANSMPVKLYELSPLILHRFYDSHENDTNP